MSVYYIRPGVDLAGLHFLWEIDRNLFLHHGWRWVVFGSNGKPVSVHSSKLEAERYLFEAEIER
jgi:hypothetical protein